MRHWLSHLWFEWYHRHEMGEGWYVRWHLHLSEMHHEEYVKSGMSPWM